MVGNNHVAQLYIIYKEGKELSICHQEAKSTETKWIQISAIKAKKIPKLNAEAPSVTSKSNTAQAERTPRRPTDSEKPRGKQKVHSKGLQGETPHSRKINPISVAQHNRDETHGPGDTIKTTCDHVSEYKNYSRKVKNWKLETQPTTKSSMQAGPRKWQQKQQCKRNRNREISIFET